MDYIWSMWPTIELLLHGWWTRSWGDWSTSRTLDRVRKGRSCTWGTLWSAWSHTTGTHAWLRSTLVAHTWKHKVSCYSWSIIWSSFPQKWGLVIYMELSPNFKVQNIFHRYILEQQLTKEIIIKLLVPKVCYKFKDNLRLLSAHQPSQKNEQARPCLQM